MTQPPPHLAPTRPEDLYLTPPPWDIGRPQPAFVSLVEAGALSGRVLDAGCGTGEHTLMAAALGCDATGIDLASNALVKAEQKARERGLSARFLRHDARRLHELAEVDDTGFDTVLDCGLFHIFAGADRAAYADGLRAVLRPGGRYFMLGFSDQQPGRWGPHRLAREDITATFTDGWRIDTLEPATIEVTIDPSGIRAWFAALTRL
jgi:SAM-dependent methyltransferase